MNPSYRLRNSRNQQVRIRPVPWYGVNVDAAAAIGRLRTVDSSVGAGAAGSAAILAALVALLALAVKALAATHLLYAGLALGVWLGIARYVLLMVLLGFVHVLARFVQIPGGWLLAATFLLELVGVDRERALAMALIVQVSAIVSVSAVGAAALAWFGAELRELKALYASGSLPGTPPER